MHWLALAVITAVLYAASSLTLETGIVIGFVAFGMVFMGIMGVLPALVSHPTPTKPSLSRIEASPVRKPSPLGTANRSAHA